MPKSPESGPREEEIPEEAVPEKEKAWEMAKAEDEYQTLAVNTREAGLKDLAKEYEKLGGKKAKEAGKEWEKKQKEIENKIREIMTGVFKKREKFLEAEKKGEKPEIIRQRDTVPIPPDLLLKVEQVLGKKDSPYAATTVVSEGRKTEEEYYMTNLDRTTLFEKVDPKGRVTSAFINVHSKESWQRQERLEKQEEIFGTLKKEKEAREGKKTE